MARPTLARDALPTVMTVAHPAAVAAALAAVLAVAAPTTSAATRGSASITDVTVTLIDLDPTDGVTPSFTVTSQSRDIRQAYVRTPSTEQVQTGDPTIGPFGSVTLEVAADGLASRFTSLGTGTPQSVALSAISEAFAPATLQPGTFEAGTVFYGGQSIDLSPRTALVMTARLQLGADLDVVGDTRSAGAWASMSVWSLPGGQFREFLQIDGASSPGEIDTVASVRLTNPTDQVLWGTMELGVSTFAGFSHVAPVPEPAPGLLALVGGLALWVRRRARRGRAPRDSA